MRAVKLRVFASHGIVALGLAALATACGSAPSGTGLAVPSVTPTSVPVLGKMTFAAFPNTWDGLRALTVCEQWAGLRAEYVANVKADTPYQLEQWFSSTPAWTAAFGANSELKTDPNYINISNAFGMVTAGDAASLSSARLLDQACAAGD
jgi:hypothetical protein